MTLNFLELDFFCMFLKFIINLRVTLKMFVGKHQVNVILLCFKKQLDNYVLNISTCTLLAPSSKICSFFLKKILST